MNKTRIWVQYRSGQKDAVREHLRNLGATFHYDFGDLESFVVTMRDGAVDQVATHPQVADYWYASMMTKDEPVVKQVE